MSFEEEFDKIIGQKMEEASFPFDEKNWKKASLLIDAERTPFVSNKIRKISVAVMGVILLSTATVVTVNLLSNKTPENRVAVAETSPAQSPNSANQNAIEEVQPKTNETQQPSVHSTNNKLKETQFANNTISANTQLSSEISLKSIHKTNTLNPSVKQEYPASDKENSSLAHAAATELNEKNNLNESVKAENVIDKTQESDNSAITNVKAGDANTSNSEEKSDVALQPETDLTATNSIPFNSTEENKFKTLNPIPVFLESDESQNQIISTPFNFLTRYDEDYYKKGLKHKTHFLNAEAGASYLLGWQTKNGTDAKGLNWFGGLNYGLYLSKKIAFGLGLQVYTIDHIKETFSKTTKIEYGFGSTTSNTLIATNSLYYAALPLKLYYNVNETNQLGLGLNVAYLFNSKSTIETYDVMDNSKMNVRMETKKGVYEALNSTNLMLSAFYNMKFTRRFSLNGEFVYGLSDIFLNTKTINKNTETPVGVRLSLQYTLFDK